MIIARDRMTIVTAKDMQPYWDAQDRRDILSRSKFDDLRPSANMASAKARLRAHPYWVAGYAALWNVPMPSIRGLHYGARALAFNAANDHPDLWANHREKSVRVAGTSVVLECDSAGLWFEAALNEAALFSSVRERRTSGCSIGWSGTLTEGRAIAGVLTIREISILIPPSKPACAGTWVLPGEAAVTRATNILNRINPF